MGLSSARYNSAVTNGTLKLVPAVEVVKLSTGNYWVMGECGHMLDCVSPGRVQDWLDRISAQKRHKRRCASCPK